jgi:hypothetical protein
MRANRRQRETDLLETELNLVISVLAESDKLVLDGCNERRRISKTRLPAHLGGGQVHKNVVFHLR